MVIQGHFDDVTNEIIRGMWVRLKKAGLPSPQLDQGHVPHITFATGHRDSDKPVRWHHLKGQRALPLTFCAFGTFSNHAGALFLSPVFTTPLRELHERIVADVPFKQCADYYLPEQWYPHCTIGIELTHEQIAEALSELRDIELPLSAKVASIHLVRYPESDVISSFVLEGGD